MAYKNKESEPVSLTYELDRIIASTNQAVLLLYDEKGKDKDKVIGRLEIFHDRLIDQSQKIGTHGVIRFPDIRQFPVRLILKRSLRNRK